MVVGTEVYHTLGNREVMVLNHVGCWANYVSPLSKMCPLHNSIIPGFPQNRLLTGLLYDRQTFLPYER